LPDDVTQGIYYGWAQVCARAAAPRQTWELGLLLLLLVMLMVLPKMLLQWLTCPAILGDVPFAPR